MKFFNLEDFKCPCGRVECDAPPMKIAFLTKLDRLGELWFERHKRLFKVNSGARCPFHNASVGGVKDSQHPYGNAADLHVDSRDEADEIRTLAAQVGMGGIGTGSHLIHVDDGPKGRRWAYP